MCSTDFDPADVFNQTRVSRSRKARKCYECDLPIPVGAPYVKTFMVLEGDADTYAVHVGCDAVSDFVRDHICRAEHDIEQASKPERFRERFDGSILLGGLDCEIDSLQDYVWNLTAEDAADAVAMGLVVEDDGDGALQASPQQVAEWAWDVAKAPYTAPETTSHAE